MFMQSIISNGGFGFCKASGFRNCNNCLYRIRCINYAPILSKNTFQVPVAKTFNLQNGEIFDGNSSEQEGLLSQENLILKHKIEELENQIKLLEQDNKGEIDSPAPSKQIEENVSSLQVYEKKSPEIYSQQTENLPLKSKKGIFGTKYVEDKPKNK